MYSAGVHVFVHAVYMEQRGGTLRCSNSAQQMQSQAVDWCSASMNTKAQQ
jgi:hypothetical protein